jgi:hypothetical protein
MKFQRLGEFTKFILEREKIHKLRLAGAPPPWTKDPILQTYRFTNVHREDDRVTKFIHETWVKDADHPDLWFALYVARVLNRPATLEVLGWPLPWTPNRAAAALFRLVERRASGAKTFTAAYVTTARGRQVETKLDYYMEVFNELWGGRAFFRPTYNDTLASFASRLMTQPGIGGFMAAQVVADIKYYEPLRSAVDLSTFALSGPGSRRGLNWVVGYEREPRSKWKEAEWHSTLLELRGKLVNRGGELDAQNLQNCLCEISKYFKVKYAGGRAKQLFKPSELPYNEVGSVNET